MLTSAYVNVCMLSCLQYFADLRNSIVNSQPPEKQQAMHLCFENLMEGIERNLLTKNRDRYPSVYEGPSCHRGALWSQCEKYWEQKKKKKPALFIILF